LPQVVQSCDGYSLVRLRNTGASGFSPMNPAFPSEGQSSSQSTSRRGSPAQSFKNALLVGFHRLSVNCVREILHAKESAELKEDELEAWKITDANEECHLLQEKYNKSTIQSSKLRKRITEITKNTINTNHKRLRPEDHGT